MLKLTITMPPIDIELAQIDGLEAAMIDAFGQSLDEEAELTARLAQEFTPVDTGALVDSAMIGNLERTGDTFKTFVSFGNAEVDYAAAMHEDLEAHHQSGGKGPKFLQRAVDELTPTRRDRLERVIDAAVQRMRP